MGTLAAILSAIAEILKQWRDFAIRTWKAEGESIATEVRDAKTDEEASQALKKLDGHMRGPK